MNQIVGIVDWYFFRDISATISFNRVVAPMFGIPTDEAAMANAMPKAKICLAEVDNLIGDGPYAAGEMLTIADLMLSPHLDFLAMTPESRDTARSLPAPHRLYRADARARQHAKDEHGGAAEGGLAEDQYQRERRCSIAV